MQFDEVEKFIWSAGRHWRLLLMISGCVALILLFPFKITVVPEWKIRVRDEKGKPFVKAKVIQIWNQRTLDIVGHDEQWTDDNGYAAFPERTARAGLLYRWWRSSRASLKALGQMDGDAEISSTVWATTPGNVSEFLEYRPDASPPEEIVMRR